MGDIMALHMGTHSIALDCKDPNSNLNFVSHAHSDHTSGIRKGSKVLSSKITQALLAVRGKPVTREDLPEGMRLLHAGHILGSSQLYAEKPETGQSAIYSGDYQIDASVVAERIETIDADVLIIDSTYPSPKVDFGDKAEIVADMQRYMKKTLDSGILLFGAYSLGKAQEIIRIANEAGIAPAVDAKTDAINAVYGANGISLDYASIGKDEVEFEAALKDNFIGIVSPHKLGRAAQRIASLYNKRVFTAVATGFAKIFNMGTDMQFPLSDHADFGQAVEYIERCNPKIIYTHGSNESAVVFASHLKRRGYRAQPLSGSDVHVAACDTALLKYPKAP